MFKKSFFTSLAKMLTPKRLFIPTLLLFTSISVFFFMLFTDMFTTIKTTDSYSYILVFISLLILIRSFVITFSNLEIHYRKEKMILIGIDLLLFVTVLVNASVGVKFLTENSFPLNTYLIFSLAALIFYVQLFLVNAQNLLQANFINFCLYVLISILLYGSTRVDPNDSRVIAILVSGVTYISLFSECYIFFKVLRLKMKTDKIEA